MALRYEGRRQKFELPGEVLVNQKNVGSTDLSVGDSLRGVVVVDRRG